MAERIQRMRNSWDAIPPKGETTSVLERMGSALKWAKPQPIKVHTHRGRRALPDLRAARGDIYTKNA